MIGSKLAHYEITGHLGSGGMGEVYQATDSKLCRAVAIKILPEAFAHDNDRLARFEREARVLASLNHPNIATIYGLEEFGTRKFLTMELVPGETLADHIQRGPIPLDEALGIAKQIAEALEAAHALGVVHRDLKPSNVKITPDGKVKVLDFGLAKLSDQRASAPSLESSPTLMPEATLAGAIMGTAAYMSPEQARGKEVDKRADIWAFGVVLYEMLTGQRLFKGETVSNTLAAVLKEEPAWNRVPEKAQRLLRCCLERDPRRRLRDIGDAWRFLEEPTLPITHRHQSWLGWGLASIFAIIAIIAVSGWFLESRHQTPTVERSYRLSVLPPEGASFAFSALSGIHALSPDGRTLAFVAESQDTTRIWLRPLGATTARRLDGTERAYGVSWSPDGRYLAFPTPGKLKRLEVATGAVKEICPAVDVRGITWNGQGVIVFGQSNIGLREVSAEGGESNPVTLLNHAAGEEQHFWPQFLPDDKHFLFQVRSAKLELAGTYVASWDQKPESQHPLQVLANLRNAEYVPASTGDGGYLVYGRDKTLFAQRFDAVRLHLEGERFAVAEDVGARALSAFSGFSASPNGALAFSNVDGDLWQLCIVARDGSTTRTVGESDRYISPNPSHDERQVALARFEASVGTFDIWRMDIVSGITSRFTSDPSTDMNPVWSPDDKTIVFSSTRQGPYNLYRKSVDVAQAEERLRGSDLTQSPFDWSPDGKLLVYEQYEKNGQRHDIFASPLDGGEPLPLATTTFDERQPAVSPSGRWLAYLSNESGAYDVYVQSFPHARAKKRISSGGAYGPRWRGDGKELFYSTPDNVLMAVEIRSEGDELIAGTPKALFPLKSAPPSFANPFWKPLRDGQHFLVLRPAVPAQGRPITIVTNWQAELRK
jgi:serine/threonine protein kinase/dipeptidyl aminopeptidase/acylaminoacyl peptidase